MKRLFVISLAVVLALGLSIVPLPAEPAMANGTTINVPTLAYPTIQAGINAATAGDTVQVDAGTYYENITLKSGVIVQGAGADVTTIDGGDGYRVVSAYNVDSTAKLDGFTIIGNSLYGIYNYYSSPTITNNTVTGSWFGIYNSNYSSPMITDNTITGNGMYGIRNSTNSSPIITNNNITGNGRYGINNFNFSSPRITNNDITGNGYGIWNFSDCSPTIINNTILGNTYGIHNWASCSPTIINNTITGNTSFGIFNWNSCSPMITNNIITGNLAGIVNNAYSSPTITNNTITGNNYGIDSYGYSSPTITNNAITSNNYGINNDNSSSPTIDYNNVWGNSPNYIGCFAGPKDISEDPLFVNPGAGDYHLQRCSPCINKGWNDAPGLPATDFEGDPRILPEGGLVDIGADEYVPVPPAAPTGLTATPGYRQVSLDWNDNTECDLDGYNVYRTLTSGSGYSKINVHIVVTSNYTDTGLTIGTTYYYVVTAVDLNSKESGYSNEDNATPIQDAIPPVITVKTPEPYGIYTLGTPLEFSAIDDISGVESVIGYLNDGYGTTDVKSGYEPAVGVYTLVVEATDFAGNTATTDPISFVVYDPEGGFATGGGWFWSAPGNLKKDFESEGKATFGFVVKYKQEAVAGNLEFQYHVGDINLKSMDMTWLTVSSTNAKFQGEGTINGEGLYTFRVLAKDSDQTGNESDEFTIRIWEGTDTEADPVYQAINAELGGGNIMVHTK